jgi:hypothetical protein
MLTSLEIIKSNRRELILACLRPYMAPTSMPSTTHGATAHGVDGGLPVRPSRVSPDTARL